MTTIGQIIGRLLAIGLIVALIYRIVKGVK